MLRQVSPERVSRSPTDAAAGVGGEYVDNLLQESDRGEQRGRTDQPADWTAGNSLVDEVPDYLGVDELKADAGEQQHRYRGHQARLRTEVADQQIDILPESHAHPRLGQRLESLG